MPSPSPSAGSTNSAASLVSEGRKSTTSGGAAGAKKFGKEKKLQSFLLGHSFG